MLFAHVVPAYFAVVAVQPCWPAQWGRARRLGLWGAPLAGVVLPDVDIVTIVLAGRYINHTYDMLWMHSVFTFLSIGLMWFALWRLSRCSTRSP